MTDKKEKKVELPKPKKERTFTKTAKGTYLIKAIEEAEYTNEQLKEILNSLNRTEENIKNQVEGVEKQIEQLQAYLKLQKEKLVEIDKDKKELKKYIN